MEWRRTWRVAPDPGLSEFVPSNLIGSVVDNDARRPILNTKLAQSEAMFTRVQDSH
jgi:hypothetical protein